MLWTLLYSIAMRHHIKMFCSYSLMDYLFHQVTGAPNISTTLLVFKNNSESQAAYSVM